MNYYCKLCDYVTKNKTEFTRHENSKKHKTNILKKYSCNKCNKTFSASSSYYYHLKKCDVIKEQEKVNNTNDSNNIELIQKVFALKEEIKEKEHIIELEKMKVEHEKEKIKLLEKVLKNSNKTADKALKITSKSISAIKYANDNFKNAPKLEAINDFNLWGYNIDNDADKKKILDNLLYHSRQNSVHKVFGEHIVSLYKKENIQDQSVHATDTSRLNYIIRTNQGNALKWAIDKNGVKICDALIGPLIMYFIDILKDYQKQLTNEMLKDPININHGAQTKVENIIKMLMDVDNGDLAKETNKFIAPFFNIDK